MGRNLQRARPACYTALAALLLVCRPLAMYGGCSPPCLCSGDIVVCRGQNLSAMPANLSDLTWRLDLCSNAIASLSSSWTSRPLLRLEVLVLAQNALGAIVPGAFASTPHLRHLDLSSNRLKWLRRGMFKGLGGLEELLLFDNHLGWISGRAFEGLCGLQRLHLGRNRLTQFPSEMFDGSASLSELRVLDVSWNLLQGVPEAAILSLPPQTQAAIYLHHNPLLCSCALRAMLQQWADQHFRTVLDFQDGHRCLGGGTGEMPNCPGELRDSTPPARGVYRVRPGAWLLLPCVDSAEQEGSSVAWDVPEKEVPPGGVQRLLVHSNGTLEIQRARLEDSGTYSCTVFGGGRNGSQRSVEVIVSDKEATPAPQQSESVHTAFTALASWMVSIVLLLCYLYFSPCHCRCQRRRLRLTRAAPSTAAMQRRGSVAKKVGFTEPGMQVAAVHVSRSTGAAGPVIVRSILKNGGSSSDPHIREIYHLM